MKQFKWHSGPANEEAEQQPSSTSYFCPFCGLPAAVDQWWTTEQVEYARGVAMPQAIRAAEEQLFSELKKLNSKHVKFKQTGHLDTPEEPAPLTESDDMVIVTSPCHAWEPIKVPDDAPSPLHCLVCGSAFAL
jgi:hypothetical protein